MASSMASSRMAQRTVVARSGVRPFSCAAPRVARRAARNAVVLRAREDDADGEAEELVVGEHDMIRTLVGLGEEALLEAELAKSGKADADAGFLAAAAAAATARAFTTPGAAYDSLLEEMAQAAAAEAADAGSPEDVVGAHALDALMASDATSGMSPEQLATAERQVQALKLSADELRTLVPRDWDDATVEWFSSRRADDLPLPEYKLAFLWTDKNIAVSVDQVYARGGKAPLTEYFFWPRRDAWEDLKAALEARPWIAERDKVILLNRLTEVINYWQEEEAKHSVEEARSAFPDCAFAGV